MNIHIVTYTHIYIINIKYYFLLTTYIESIYIYPKKGRLCDVLYDIMLRLLKLGSAFWLY